ncbi:MAG: HDOD domain-containing protein [Rhodoferax sp.]|nr:HDOD domain-containing protein [Rhodoferax sp.]
MDPELAKKLIAAVDRMPAFPKNVQELLELTRHMDCSPKEVVLVIEKDPVLTVKILRVINAAYFNLRRPITSVNHAVIFLGFNTIKNLSLGVAAIGILPAHNSADFDGQQCLLHSLSCAGIAQQIALRVADVDPMECYVAGLLHDFGKLVLAQYFPDEFKQALEHSLTHATSLHLSLREIMGIDHSSIGAMLVEKWRFPEKLVEAIRYQYGPELKDTPMIACVFTANQISKKLAFGFAGNTCVEELPPSIVTRLGGNLDEVIASLGDLAPMYEEAKKFSRM